MHIGVTRFRTAAAPIARGRRARHVPDRGRRRRPAALRVRPRLVRRRARRDGGRARPTRRSCSRCSGRARSRAQRHGARRRVRRERSGRHRADDQPDRGRRRSAGTRPATSASQFLLQMVVGAAVGVVGGRALLWFMRRDQPAGRGAVPAADAGLRARAVRRGHAAARLGLPRRLRRRHRARRRARAVQARDRALPLGAGQPRRDRRVRRARPDRRPRRADPRERAGARVSSSPSCSPSSSVPSPSACACCRPGCSATRSAFVLFAGLKGAVPLLLGELILAAHVPDAQRLYGIVVVVVVFSVLVQGSLTPAAADVLQACRCTRSNPSRGRSACGCATSRRACTGSPSGPARRPRAGASTI